MGIMVGLVLFSSSVALLLYLKNDKLKENVQLNIETYVAAKNLKKGDLLDATSIVKAKLPKSYINFTPLTDSEIINRYAKVDIYKNEPIRLEKLSTSKPILQSKKVKTAQQIKIKKTIKVQQIQQINHDTISIPLSLFKNKDTSLKSGDFVDIASVIPSKNKKKTDTFNTKYIALHVKINNFVNNGNVTTSPITYNAKKQAIHADTVVLVMSPKDIKNFLAVYYKTQALNINRVYNTNNYGGQLWMIKTPKIVNEQQEKLKQKLMFDRKIYTKKRKKQTQKVKISYED